MNREKLFRAILDKHHVAFGSSSDDWINDPERMERCDEAAEDGWDGSTHRENLEDMRETLHRIIPYRCERFRCAADDYIDAAIEWHTANGTIDEQVG